MIMSRHLHDCIHLGQWHIGLDTINESAEALTRVLERQGWTVLKPLIAGQQGGRDETGDVGLLANIHSQIQGVMRQDGKQLSIWEHWCFVSHERAPFVLRVSLTRAGVGGEAGSRGRASTNFGPEVWPSTSYQVCLPRPPGFFQESSSKAFAGFCGIFASRERSDCASPL